LGFNGGPKFGSNPKSLNFKKTTCKITISNSISTHAVVIRYKKRKSIKPTKANTTKKSKIERAIKIE
jgi:hypothetical protein